MVFFDVCPVMTYPNNEQNQTGRATLPTVQDMVEARRRMTGIIDMTPLAGSEYISSAWGCRVLFKLENLHSTGSFKERGALNKLLTLTDSERLRGVITASAGNHGQAVAFHARRLDIKTTVVMPVNTPLIKAENTKMAGASVMLHGANYDESAARAREICRDENLVYIHPFDDPQVIAGQGTLGLEMLEQNPGIDLVVVPVGGGGLIAGVAMTLKAAKSKIRVVGVQSDRLPSMITAIRDGAPITLEPARTIADGIAVRRAGGLTLQIVQRYVDEIVTVSDDEIANAILLMLEREKAVVEGAGAVGVAAMHNRRIPGVEGKTVAVILSGGNIDVNMLSRVIDKGLVKDGRLAKLRVVVPDHPGQLSHILGIIAKSRANILEISHQRAFSEARVGETSIDLVLETRGNNHINDMCERLMDAGVRATRQMENR